MWVLLILIKRLGSRNGWDVCRIRCPTKLAHYDLFQSSCDGLPMIIVCFMCFASSQLLVRAINWNPTLLFCVSISDNAYDRIIDTTHTSHYSSYVYCHRGLITNSRGMHLIYGRYTLIISNSWDNSMMCCDILRRRLIPYKVLPPLITCGIA
jgi:hypothetical protein